MDLEVSAEPTPLTRELLERLRAAIADAGAPVAPALGAGLSSGEMDAITGPVGLLLPPELKIWWGWELSPDEGLPIGRSFDRLSLPRALESTAQTHEIDQLAGTTPGFGLPVTGIEFARSSSGSLFIDTADHGPVSPIGYYDNEAPVGWTRIESLGVSSSIDRAGRPQRPERSGFGPQLPRRRCLGSVGQDIVDPCQHLMGLGPAGPRDRSDQEHGHQDATRVDLARPSRTARPSRVSGDRRTPGDAGANPGDDGRRVRRVEALRGAR